MTHSSTWRYGKHLLLIVAIALGAALALPVYRFIAGAIGMYHWGRTEVKDVSDQPSYHGGFQVGGVYRLKHGVYLYDPKNGDLPALTAPAKYGVDALTAAIVTYGNIDDIPDAPVFRADLEPRGLPPVESLAPGEIPERYASIIPAGTRLRIERILLSTSGDNVSRDVHANILDGGHANTVVRIRSLTTSVVASNYGSNPLILEQIEAGQ